MPEDERGTRRIALFDQLLALFPAGRCVDLGAGHGKFSTRASSAGWDVTAVDVRRERFDGDGRVEFVEADVRSYDPSGFDLVLCLGLFYHLTLADQIDLLRRIDGTPLMLDTHVATGLYDSRMEISEPVKIDEYEGVHYQEGEQSDPRSSWVTTASSGGDRCTRRGCGSTGRSVMTGRMSVVDTQSPTSGGPSMPARPLLSLEREEIRCGIIRGETVTAIADRIGRHRCTVSAEISRNGGREKYRPFRAHDRAARCQKRPKVRLFQHHPELALHVAARLEAKDSPLTIAVELANGLYPEITTTVSHETIYQEIYDHQRGVLP